MSWEFFDSLFFQQNNFLLEKGKQLLHKDIVTYERIVAAGAYF